MNADDNDVVKALGFVALYAAYLEEQVDNLLLMLSVLEPFPAAQQRWPIGKKIEKARRLVGTVEFEAREPLLADLASARELFDRRNEVIHGRIYANFDRPDTLKSGRPNVPDRVVEATELRELAAQLFQMRSDLSRPMVIKLPRALANRE